MKYNLSRVFKGRFLAHKEGIGEIFLKVVERRLIGNSRVVVRTRKASEFYLTR